jgi:hypothetical protein
VLHAAISTGCELRAASQRGLYPARIASGGGRAPPPHPAASLAAHQAASANSDASQQTRHIQTVRLVVVVAANYTSANYCGHLLVDHFRCNMNKRGYGRNMSGHTGRAASSMRSSNSQPLALLCAQVLHPALYCQPVQYAFGQQHLDTSHSRHAAKTWVHLQNPTTVDAQWRLVHVPQPIPKTRAARARQAASLVIESAHALGPCTDMPEVFQFEQMQGIVKGPTREISSIVGRLPSTPIGGGRIPSSTRIAGGRLPSTPIGGDRIPSSTRIARGRLPRQSFTAPREGYDQGGRKPPAIGVAFHPAGVGRYRSRFRFELMGGEIDAVCDLILEGAGTVNESGLILAQRTLRRW